MVQLLYVVMGKQLYNQRNGQTASYGATAVRGNGETVVESEERTDSLVT